MHSSFRQNDKNSPQTIHAFELKNQTTQNTHTIDKAKNKRETVRIVLTLNAFISIVFVKMQIHLIDICIHIDIISFA